MSFGKIYVIVVLNLLTDLLNDAGIATDGA